MRRRVFTSAALSAQRAQLEVQNVEKDALPGHQREAPGSNPPPPRNGELAVGHPVSDTTPTGDRFDPGRVDTHMWCQPPMTPRAYPEIRPLTPEGDEYQAIGSSITEQQDRHNVTLQNWDAARAATVQPLPGNPNPDPHGAQAPNQQMHTAPSGVGQQFRQSPQRSAGNPYMPVPGEGAR